MPTSPASPEILPSNLVLLITTVPLCCSLGTQVQSPSAFADVSLTLKASHHVSLHELQCLLKRPSSDYFMHTSPNTHTVLPPLPHSSSFFIILSFNLLHNLSIFRIICLLFSSISYITAMMFVGLITNVFKLLRTESATYNGVLTNICLMSGWGVGTVC